VQLQLRQSFRSRDMIFARVACRRALGASCAELPGPITTRLALACRTRTAANPEPWAPPGVLVDGAILGVIVARVPRAVGTAGVVRFNCATPTWLAEANSSP
jgi:hypothetical protein